VAIALIAALIDRLDSHFRTFKSVMSALRALSFPFLYHDGLTGKFVNTALENREYTDGIDPSYIRT
jgi:hypothetical protein